MKVKRYRATDRAVALKQIRAELGPHAVIVHEQRVRPGLFGLFGKPEIEVLAAVEEENVVAAPARQGASSAAAARAEVESSISPAAQRMADARAAAADAVRRGAAAAQAPDGAGRLAAILQALPQSGQSVSSTTAASLSDMISRAAIDGSIDMANTASLRRLLADAAESNSAASAAPAAPLPDARLAPIASLPLGSPDAASRAATGLASAAPETATAAQPGNASAAAVPPATQNPSNESIAAPGVPVVPVPTVAPAAGTGMIRDMQHTLVELRSAVDRLTRQSQDAQAPREAPAVRQVYQHLIAQEAEPTIALDLVGQISEEVGPDQDADPQLVRGRLLELLEERLPSATLERREGEPSVVILVGPTGVGKTTTLAKLAARFALEEGQRVCLITTDTFRIAAAGQLGTYADIMDLPLEIVYSAADLSRAFARHPDIDLFLVDTPGCAQRNDVQLAELSTFVQAALEAIPSACVLLTLAAPTKLRDLLEIQQGFSIMPLNGLVLSKLDETSTYGPLLSVVSQADRPVYFFTNGQNVPIDIQPATSSRLAALVADGLFPQVRPNEMPPAALTPFLRQPGETADASTDASAWEAPSTESDRHVPQAPKIDASAGDTQHGPGLPSPTRSVHNLNAFLVRNGMTTSPAAGPAQHPATNGVRGPAPTDGAAPSRPLPARTSQIGSAGGWLAGNGVKAGSKETRA